MLFSPQGCCIFPVISLRYSVTYHFASIYIQSEVPKPHVKDRILILSYQQHCDLGLKTLKIVQCVT
jgi:hypothetical protein